MKTIFRPVGWFPSLSRVFLVLAPLLVLISNRSISSMVITPTPTPTIVAEANVTVKNRSVNLREGPGRDY
jgi:hypothetical protein